MDTPSSPAGRFGSGQTVNEALVRLIGLFNLIYADTGRASIAPEKLLRAMLVQVFFSVRSERQLIEQVRYNLLCRWFIGLAIDDEVWDPSTFSKNPGQLLEGARRGRELLHRGHDASRQAQQQHPHPHRQPRCATA
jgi:hypothetical protein